MPKIPKPHNRQRVACELVTRKALISGCNTTDIALGHWTASYWLRRGRSVHKAVQVGLAMAHRTMDRRTAREHQPT
jgi:hypothetical protein